MINTNEILKKLPKSWKEVTLSQYQRLLPELTALTETATKNFEEEDALYYITDSMFVYLSVFTGLSIEELTKLNSIDLIKLSNRLSFIDKQPDFTKETSIEWKAFDEIKYKDLVTYMILHKSHIQNMHLIIKAFSKTELTDEQIANLSMQEVSNGFFLLQKLVRKSMSHSKWRLRKVYLKQITKEKLAAFMRIFRSKRK